MKKVLEMSKLIIDTAKNRKLLYFMGLCNSQDPFLTIGIAK